MSRTGSLLVLAALLSFLLQTNKSSAQCCSTGSPVGTTVNAGVLSKKTLRVIAFYRHSYSDTYYEEDHQTDKNTALLSANYDFAGLTFGYGITKRLTLEADFGFIEKPLKQFEMMGGLGLRYPFTFEPQMKDGVQLSPDVQPSTHAFGVSGILFLNKGFPGITLRIFSINKYDYNFQDKNNYQYGSILMNSIFASKKIVKNLFGILQVRSEFKSRDKDEGVERENTGYELVTLTPQLSYSIAGRWNVSALYDIPIYKYYNFRQLTPKSSFAISFSTDINFGQRFK
jgi:hypothetical protein